MLGKYERLPEVFKLAVAVIESDIAVMVPK
jgi:hypothetical protein